MDRFQGALLTRLAVSANMSGMSCSERFEPFNPTDGIEPCVENWDMREVVFWNEPPSPVARSSCR